MTRPQFAATAPIPGLWKCHRCGQPADRDQDHPPSAPAVEPYKTHLAYVRGRRSDQDAEILLAEALTRLRAA